MTYKEIIQSYSPEEHARLDYAAHVWRRCGYEVEAEAAQDKADNYYLAYRNALQTQAGLPETTLEEFRAWRQAYHQA